MQYSGLLSSQVRVLIKFSALKSVKHLVNRLTPLPSAFRFFLKFFLKCNQNCLKNAGNPRDMRRFQVSHPSFIYRSLKLGQIGWFTLKNSPIRLFERERGSGVEKKSVIVRITDSRNYYITFKGKVERRIVVRASRFFFNFWKERKKLVEETAISRWSAIVVGSWDPHPRDVIQGVGN